MNVSSPPALSPCVGICYLDEHDLCEGCHRSGAEIAGWPQMSNEERLRIMETVLPAREALRV
jgi:predicted Fe-S protein YdhL (DUF1289 family)